MELASRYDRAVIVAVCFTAQIGGLVILGLQLRRMGTMVTEDQRLTRAVGALVIQEADKTRAAVRERP